MAQISRQAMLHNIVGGVRGVGRGERWWWTGGRGKDLRLTFDRPCHSQICRYCTQWVEGELQRGTYVLKVDVKVTFSRRRRKAYVGRQDGQGIAFPLTLSRGGKAYEAPSCQQRVLSFLVEESSSCLVAVVPTKQTITVIQIQYILYSPESIRQSRMILVLDSGTRLQQKQKGVHDNSPHPQPFLRGERYKVDLMHNETWRLQSS